MQCLKRRGPEQSPQPRRAKKGTSPVQLNKVATESLVGAALGILLALVVIGWTNDSLGTDPGRVEIMAEVVDGN